MGDNDADPRLPQFLGRMNRGATAAERVEHRFAGIGKKAKLIRNRTKEQ